MHHKYVVRDGESVWTGSLNWTDDSWSRQENVVVTIHSRDLASRFTKDFEQLWHAGNVEETGRVDPSAIHVDGVEVRAWFTPTYGEDLSHRIANAIGRARRRVRICSPVLTAAPVISTLAQRISDGGLDVAGCIDSTQINGVFHDWHRDGNAAWKIPILERVLRAPFSGKPSLPYAAQSVHDFMHAKVTVADDVVFTGSFNLSHRGEKNAENMLEIHDAALAERLAAVRGRGAGPLPALSEPRGNPGFPREPPPSHLGAAERRLGLRSGEARLRPRSSSLKPGRRMQRLRPVRLRWLLRPARRARRCLPGWKRIPLSVSRQRGLRRRRNSRSIPKCLNSSPIASSMIDRASSFFSTSRRW